MSDPLGELRERIEANDAAIVAGINERLRLVAEIKRVKEEHGIEFVDPERERFLLKQLAAANGGPLSEAGLYEIYAALLELTKRELA